MTAFWVPTRQAGPLQTRGGGRFVPAAQHQLLCVRIAFWDGKSLVAAPAVAVSWRSEAGETSRRRSCCLARSFSFPPSSLREAALLFCRDPRLCRSAFLQPRLLPPALSLSPSSQGLLSPPAPCASRCCRAGAACPTEPIGPAQRLPRDGGCSSPLPRGAVAGAGTGPASEGRAARLRLRPRGR